MGAPWFKLYANDLLSDSKIRLLTDDQLGKLVKLWAFNCKDGAIPSDLAIASRLLGNCSGEDLAWVNSFFQADGETFMMFSPRMRAEQTAYDTKCEKLRLSAQKGGLQKVANAKANAIANGLANPSESESESEVKDSTPLPPKGGRKQKAKTDLDCQPENEESIRRVYDSWPKVNPGGEPAKKGSFAQAARAFQKIINTGEATARELKSCGLLYAKAEAYPERLRQRIFEAWDHRDHAVMHVATFYGPDKRPYRQMLAIAREVIAESDAQALGVAS